MSKRISQLPNLTDQTVSSNDLLPILDVSPVLETKKITISDISNYVKNNVEILSASLANT